MKIRMGFATSPLSCACVLLLACAIGAYAQSRTYPKEIRGYKVERTSVEMKNSGNKTKARKTGREEESSSDSDVDELIQFGQPRLDRLTPLGITFEVPIVVAPVKQSGHVDFLLFEDMVVNGQPVEIDEYDRDFDLPNKKALTLREPVSVYIYLPRALLTAVDEWNNSKQTWPVKGRVYVFGKFKKSLFSFKRCIPVELNLTMHNPLREH